MPSTTDFDLLDEEEELETFDDAGRQTGTDEDEKADEPATGADATGSTTPDGEEPAKDGETDWELKATELEFELETLRSEVPDLQKARAFLDDAAAATDSDALMAAIAKHVGVDLQQGPQTARTDAGNGGGWEQVDALLAKTYEDGLVFDDSTKELVGAIKGAFTGTVSRLGAEIASLKASLGKIEPHVTEAQKSKESAEKESATARRASGIASLVISMSPARNSGWQPTKEQVVEVAKKHPDVFDTAKDAKSLAAALLEKVRGHHVDDIIGHKTGQKRPAVSATPVPKNDARGSDNGHESRKAAIKARMRSGI